MEGRCTVLAQSYKRQIALPGNVKRTRRRGDKVGKRTRQGGDEAGTRKGSHLTRNFHG